MDDRTPRAGLSGVVVEHDGARVGLLPVLARALSAGGPAGEHRALTDGTGAFAFPHLPDGDYLVRTEDTDLYDSATATVRASAGALVIVVERKPFEWIELRGTVRSPRGAIGGARIDVLGQEAPGAVSSDAGAFAMRVPASRRAMAAALRVRRSGFRERQVPLSSAQQLSDREWVLDVSLDPLSAVVPVTGRVSGEDGRPVERATVQLESAARRQAYRAMTDAAGRFQIAAVETGSDYRLWVRPRATYKDALREPVTIEEGGTPLDVVLHPLATTTLTARVVALDGSPVPNFTLTLTSAYGSAARALEARTGADGRLRVEDLPEGPLALATRAAPRLSISGVVLAADATRELTLPIDVGSHRVEGRVVSADGTPIGGAVLSMQWSSSFDGIVSRSSRETVTTDDGRFVFSHLGPGVRVIAVRAQGFAPAHVQHVTGTSPGALDIRIARTRNWEEE